MTLSTDTITNLIKAGASARVNADDHSGPSIIQMARELHPGAYLTVLHAGDFLPDTLLTIVRAAPIPSQVIISSD